MTSDTNIFDTLDLEADIKSESEVSRILAGRTSPEAQQAAPVSAPVDQEGAVLEEAPEEAVDPLTAAEGFKHAFKYETLLGFGVRQALSPKFEADPKLALTLQYFEDNYGDLSEDQREFVQEGDSLAEIEHRGTFVRQRIEDQRRFDAMPMGSQLGLLLAATLADAPALAASALAGAVTAGAGTAVTAGRIGVTGARILRVLGGAVGVGIEAAVQEGILATADPIKNQQTTMLAGLTGFAFGAGGAAIGQKFAASKIRKAALKDAQDLGDHLIRQAAKEVAGEIPTNTQSNFLTSTTAFTPLDNLFADIPAADVKALRKAGIDVTSQLKRSKDEGYRQLGTILGEDGIFGGSPTMALEFDVSSRPVLADGIRGVHSGYRAWAKENNTNVISKSLLSGRKEFSEQVGILVREANPQGSKGHMEAVQATRKFMKDMLDVAQRSGLKGFDSVDADITYLTRMPSPAKFTALTKSLGNQSDRIIQRTIKGALLSADNTMDDEMAGVIAKGYYRRFMGTSAAPDSQFTTVLTNDIKEELTGLLADADVDAPGIERILAKLTEKSDAGVSQGRRRLEINEGFVDIESGLKFSDLLENNVEAIMARYSRSVGGASAAAKFGFDTPDKLFSNLDTVRRKAIESGSLSERQANTAHRKASNLAKQILGRPVEEFGAWKQGAQLFMDYEYLRTSGGFALASLPEMMITTAEDGFTTTLKHIPIFNKFVNDIRKGIPADQEILNIIESWGIGRDLDLNNAFVAIAEDDAFHAASSTAANVFRRSKRVAGLASGLPQLTKFSQLIAGKSSIQKFTDMAFANKPVVVKRWLKQLGYESVDEIDNMYKGLRKYSTRVDSILGGKKVVGLDYKGWVKEDPVAATKFMYGVARRVNHQIQRQLPGEVPEFMSFTAGKLVTQFQGFGIAAYGKKTLNAIARHDVESAVAIGLTSVMAGLVTTARLNAIALTKDDPQLFRDENLTPSQIVKFSLQRGGYSSILPNMIDSTLSITKAAGITDTGSVFSKSTRTSGLDVGGLESIPSSQTAFNALRVMGAGADQIQGGEIEEKDVRALVDSLPLRRLPGINFAFEKLINEFPQRGREK